MGHSQYHAALEEIAPHREALRTHEVYGLIESVADVQTFMEHHVYAVWDFMSLLKALQRVVTCVDTPWVPRGDPQTRRLINEIVIGEESDELPDGRVMSHFEMYLQAMEVAGADITPITRFVDEIRAGHLVHVALQKSGAPAGSGAFVLGTMDVVNVGKPHAIAAAFAIGREDIIPTMFMEIVGNLATMDRRLDLFEFYLDRHIQLDGEEHSGLAMNMLANLCEGKEERWQECAAVAVAALQSRKALWDCVANQLKENHV